MGEKKKTIDLPALPPHKETFTTTEVAVYMGIEKVAASRRVGREYKKGDDRITQHTDRSYEVSREKLVEMRALKKKHILQGSDAQIEARKIPVPGHAEFSVEAATRYLGVSRRRVQALCKEGRLGRLVNERVGSRNFYVITREEILTFREIPRVGGKYL